MNTYVIPLNCERKEADSDAHQLAIFVCRTMQDYQYSRISFQGESIRGLDGWDIADAKVSTIFVPNDAHVLDLPPHGGLPIVHIDSNLHAWSLRPRRNFGRAILEPELVNRGRELTTIASPNEQPPVPPVPPARHDLESGTARNHDLRDSGPVLGAYTVQKQVSQIQFCPQDLKKGRMVAFTRMSTSRAEFYYNVEIGFDMEFNPVCFLHVRRFSTTPGLRSHWLGAFIVFFFDTFPWIKCQQGLPICGSFWTDKRCRRVTSGTNEIVRVVFGSSIYLYSRLLEECALCSANEEMEDHVEVGMGWGAGAKHHDPLIWKFTGHRADGFEEYVKELPFSYGCVNVKLTCRPRNPDTPGLDWLLTLREEPLHPRPLRQGVFCWQNMLPSIYPWCWIMFSGLSAVMILGRGLLLLLGIVVWFTCGSLGAAIDLGAAILATIGVMALSLVPPLFVWLVPRIMFGMAPWTVLQPERRDWLWRGSHKWPRQGITI